MEGKIFIAGPKLGSDQQNFLIIQRGLYRFKFWGVAFWSFHGKIWDDRIGDTYLSAELAIPRHGYEYPQYTRVIKVRKDQEKIQWA